MGFWDFLRGKRTTRQELRSHAERAPGAESSKVEGPAEDATEFEALSRVGLAGGPTPEAAAALFETFRHTSKEALALEVLVRTAHERTLPARLLEVIATALIDRGEHEVAGRVLGDATSPTALVMLADLAEARGQPHVALSLIERVLVGDFDELGARERHARLRARLDYAPRARPVPEGATLLAHDESESPFVLVRELGRGGSAAVYEATDRDLGRTLALKIYHRHDRDRAQLQHEARTASALRGPGIVTVYDLDPERGWLALALAKGGTLRERIAGRTAEGLVPLERWAVPLATSLARVHAAGWVHHDVKPANVLIDASGAPVLTDFGTARPIGTPSPPGSLGYVSPERLAGGTSDPRDDLYGFGRIVEDVLAVLGDEALRLRHGRLAAMCTGPAEGRPVDAAALVAWMKANPGD